MRRTISVVAGIIVFILALTVYNSALAESVPQLVDAQASKDADMFLKGLKIIDLPEGKQMIANTAFKSNELPVLIDSSTLYEGMFDTDINGLRGYKRLLQVSVQSKAGTELKKKYILVSYKDLKDSNWKVLGFRESVDLDFEYQAAKKRKDEPFAGIQEMLPMSYMQYGNWASLAGKLQESIDAYKKAGELYRADRANILKKLSPKQVLIYENADDNIQIIKRIIIK